jgi:hypothetical protein
VENYQTYYSTLEEDHIYFFIHRVARVTVYNRPREPTIAVVVVQQTDSDPDCYYQENIFRPRMVRNGHLDEYIYGDDYTVINMRLVGRLINRGTKAMRLSADVPSQWRWRYEKHERLVVEPREDMPRDEWIYEWVASSSDMSWEFLGHSSGDEVKHTECGVTITGNVAW